MSDNYKDINWQNVSVEMADDLRKQAQNGKTAEQLGEKYNTHGSTIRLILISDEYVNGTPNEPNLEFINRHIGWVEPPTNAKTPKQKYQ